MEKKKKGKCPKRAKNRGVLAIHKRRNGGGGVGLITIRKLLHSSFPQRKPEILALETGDSVNGYPNGRKQKRIFRGLVTTGGKTSKAFSENAKNSTVRPTVSP